MSSEARQTANAANARLSTGPSTEEGKARSSQNARTHGLTAARLVIAPEDGRPPKRRRSRILVWRRR